PSLPSCTTSSSPFGKSSVSFRIVSYSTMSIFSVTSSVVISGGLVTFTVAVSVWLPSSVLTVIVAVPAPIAVISPLAFTFAMASSSDSYVTFLLVALLGSIVAFSCRVPSTSKLFVLGATVTLVTLIG